jgi:hypothetical protein
LERKEGGGRREEGRREEGGGRREELRRGGGERRREEGKRGTGRWVESTEEVLEKKKLT